MKWLNKDTRAGLSFLVALGVVVFMATSRPDVLTTEWVLLLWGLLGIPTIGAVEWRKWRDELVDRVSKTDADNGDNDTPTPSGPASPARDVT